MLKWNDPKKPHEIVIDGVTFFAKALTTGRRLKMLDEIRALRGVEADFDDMMKTLAKYIERIEFKEEVGGVKEAAWPTITMTDPKKIEQACVYMDNIDYQWTLMEEVMAANRMRKEQVKN